MRKILSVDWDYFFPDLGWMDWGHSESALFIQHLWTMRCGDFNLKTRQSALDYVVPDREPMLSFWDRVLRKDAVVKVVIAESHSELYRVVTRETNHVDLVDNYDQHHDCGYGNQTDRDHRIDCGNWASVLLFQEYIKSYAVHYPTWRKKDPERSRKELKKRLGPNGSWDCKLPKAPQRYDIVFICRSGGWTPPWADDLFVEFIQLLFKTHSVGKWRAEFASAKNDSGVAVGPRHPNMEEALKLREQFVAQRKRMADSLEIEKLRYLSEPIISPKRSER